MKSVITRAHSFVRAAEFWAEPQNFFFSAEFYISAEFCRSWKLLATSTIFDLMKTKLNCQKLWALLIAIAIWHNRK